MTDTPHLGTNRLKIIMVAENVSRNMSGETILPYYYLTNFLALGHEVHVICHARTRKQLQAELDPELFARFTFVSDGPLQKMLFRIGGIFPHRVEDLIFNQLIQLLTQLRMRRMVKEHVARDGADVVFQPAPIAVKAISFMHRVGAPVVIGPMSGGMDLPPAFRKMDGRLVRLAIAGTRYGSRVLHCLFRGKRDAAVLLVANRRTRMALPPGMRGEVREVMESAVDLGRWRPRSARSEPGGTMSFIFCGRFVDWKGIDYLVRAFVPLAREGGVRLDLVGDGELFGRIEELIQAEGISDCVVMHGRVPLERYIALLHEADAYVSPSLRECGGIAMMEAMAVGVPVIATEWGGAAQYAGSDCAILVPPTSERAFVDGLTAAMRRLAASPDLRRALGRAGRSHLEREGHDWAVKARHVAAILHEASGRHRLRVSRAALMPVPLSQVV
ncbi:MAG: glycosyltransferase family 4 protein [Sphingomonas sp.]|uniref:glycosyltransferase family 4 protein n=1 Tax=Sphingomonas sp. TaxID=28214 RepID=UPI001B0D0735|nr:glycosyltransferase family 4 protein [Sphingomonas sp.]MBO9623904.1 glycosyltransferase family 4 protein [Sphingomonas sp.]